MIQIRKIIAERDFYKSAFEESERQKIEWQKSAGNWEKLFNAEKHRADVVQQNRIDELAAANAELRRANLAYQTQAENDKRQLSENAFTIRKLKSERKWVFAAGFGTGFGAGGLTGYQVGRRFTF